MRKTSFGLVLLVFIFAITLGGCACFQQETKSAEVTTRQPEVVQQAPPSSPPAYVPPKKARN